MTMFSSSLRIGFRRSLRCLTLPGVGAVAPKLLYLDNRIQHAGMVTGTRRLLGTAFHAYPRSTTANMSACAERARSIAAQRRVPGDA